MQQEYPPQPQYVVATQESTTRKTLIRMALLLGFILVGMFLTCAKPELGIPMLAFGGVVLGLRRLVK